MEARAEELALKRLRIFARICFVWGLIIIGRLVQLQVIQHEKYRQQALEQQEREIEMRAPRGAILDRNGQKLAMSVSVDSVCVNPMRIPDRAVAADLLARVLDLNSGELLEKLNMYAEARKGFLWVKRKISLEESERLRAYNFDWIELRPESTRFYPNNQLAAHVLGGVDHEEKGNGGVEQFLDKELKGTAGVMRATSDVRRTIFDMKVFSDPQPGTNLTLSIDERIQFVAEQELAKAVKSHGASTGSIVAMDPKTGDILAMANYPTFNPNESPKDKNDAEARKNLAIMAPFEPGSVFKVITLSTALETTRLSPQSSFHCGNGAFTLFRRVIHDSHPYGMLSMAEILAKSSNIGAIKIGLTAGNENLYKYVRAFGFGAKTGLPLPGESSGILRRLERWIPSSIGSVAMGHEVSTTTLQLARACSVIANGGFLVKPRLVIKAERGGAAVPVKGPELQPIMKPENAIKMRMMMRGVVDCETGCTGRRAKVKGYSVAGKTGSAQIYDFKARVYTHRYNGSFMGFAPINNPSIVIVVTLNNTPSGDAGFGGVVAAPVFQKVMTAALRIRDVPRDIPDEPSTPEKDDTSDMSDVSVADLALPPDFEEADQERPVMAAGEIPAGPKAPDFRGKTKSEVMSQSLESGVRVQIAGAGVARRQVPVPGTVLQPGERVRVVFTR